MAHQTPITRWLVENRLAMGLYIKEFDWSKHWPSAVFDFQVELEFNGQKSIGRGTDSCESLALEKACSEAIERIVCAHFRTSTKGVAVHSKLEAAAENSKLEAAERGLFEWHLRNRISFQPLKGDPECSIISRWTRSHGTKVSFFETIPLDGLRCVVCLIKEDGQLLIGSSCSTSRDASIRKSLIEATRNLLTFRDEPTTFFIEITTDPDLWCANAESIGKFLHLFESASIPSSRPGLNFKTELYNLYELRQLQGCPAFAVRSTLYDRCP